MRVYVQVIDSKTGVYQTGVIDEPVKEGFEVQNAISHFGVNYGHVEWNKSFINNAQVMFGNIRDTSKIVSVICNI